VICQQNKTKLRKGSKEMERRKEDKSIELSDGFSYLLDVEGNLLFQYKIVIDYYGGEYYCIVRAAGTRDAFTICDPDKFLKDWGLK